MMTEATANPSEDSPGLAAALTMAARGFDVFPCVVGGKIPAVPAWQRRATRDPDKIRAMWTDRDPVNEITYDRGYNPAIYTARYGDRFLCVVDVDVKRERGDTEWACLVLDNGGVPETFTVRTPSGGFHLFFVTDKPVRTTRSTIAPSVDTSGVDGFVVAAGATAAGLAYRVERDLPIAELPDWLYDLIGPPAARQEHEKVVSILDSAVSIDKARDFLARREPAIQGAGGNTWTFKTAARLKDLGVSELTALELMLEEWNGTCVPPWPYEELAVVVSHAYEYGKRPAGVDSAENAFRDPPEGEGGPERRRDERAGEGGQAGPEGAGAANDDRPGQDGKARTKALPWKREDALGFRADRPPDLVDGYLGTNKLAIVYGPSNAGKTAVVMGLAYAVATGEAWYGNAVERGAVVYVAAEAAASVEDRALATRMHYGRTGWPLYVVGASVDIADREQVKQILEAVREIAADSWSTYGVGVRLVIVDTLAAATPGTDENNGKEMGAVLGYVRELQGAVSTASVLLIHHTGKDATKGARGWSGMRAAVDTALEVRDGKIITDKQRDMAFGKTLGFELRGITIGTRTDGKEVTSVIALPCEPEPDEFPDWELSDQQKAIMRGLIRAYEAAGDVPVTTKSVVEAMGLEADSANQRKVRTQLGRMKKDKECVRGDGETGWSPAP